MTDVETYNCESCGAPLSPKLHKCEYCGSYLKGYGPDGKLIDPGFIKNRIYADKMLATMGWKDIEGLLGEYYK
jgi:hypothetical protein